MRLMLITSKARPDVRSARFRRSTAVLATRQGDGVVLLDTRAERYFTLNDVGGHVWGVLATPAALGQIVDSIRAVFHVPAGGVPEVERDVAALLTDLQAAGLVIADSGDIWS